MYNGHRVVVVTPAGRRRYMEVLLSHILSQKNAIDEWQLWVNTTDQDDIAWMMGEAQLHPGFVKLVPCPIAVDPGHISGSIHAFFPGCVEPGTIYIRCDDDIVWMHPICIEELCDTRLSDREPFIVSANVINNAIMSHLHQRIGAIPRTIGNAGYECMDKVGWESGVFAKAVHAAFFGAIDESANSKGMGIGNFWFPDWSIWEHTRFSINMICWMGEDMAGVNVPQQEETFLTVDHPRTTGRTTKICGSALAVHYAFYTQRAEVDGDPSILERYRRLAEELT